MDPIYTCAADLTAVWCALPADISLLVPWRPIFVGTLELLHLVRVR